MVCWECLQGAWTNILGEFYLWTTIILTRPVEVLKRFVGKGPGYLKTQIFFPHSTQGKTCWAGGNLTWSDLTWVRSNPTCTQLSRLEHSFAPHWNFHGFMPHLLKPVLRYCVSLAQKNAQVERVAWWRSPGPAAARRYTQLNLEPENMVIFQRAKTFWIPHVFRFQPWNFRLWRKQIWGWVIQCILQKRWSLTFPYSEKEHQRTTSFPQEEDVEHKTWRFGRCPSAPKTLLRMYFQKVLRV